MALIDCGLEAISNPTACNDRGGIRKAYWFLWDTVDWDTMLGEPTDFDTTTHTILDYVMLGGALFYELTFQKKSAYYEFTFTEEDGVYSILVQWIFKGKDNARRLAIQNAIACCNLGLHIYANDGTQRVVGPDYNGEAIDEMLEPLRVGRHLDGSGQLGSSKARDEMDLTGESFFAPLFATVAESALPLT